MKHRLHPFCSWIYAFLGALVLTLLPFHANAQTKKPNILRMHVFTHLKPESDGKTGLGLEADGMVEHDGHVGQLLKKLDDLGIADNTIVVYTSYNGNEYMSWPHSGATPYRGEKATNWEGGYRVPTLIRWPGVIKPGTIYNDFFAHEDFLPTFAAAAGNTDIVQQCMKNCQLGSTACHVHLDGYNLIPFFTGEVKDSPRKEFLYWSDDAISSRFVTAAGRPSSSSRIMKAWISG